MLLTGMKLKDDTQKQNKLIHYKSKKADSNESAFFINTLKN